MAVRPPLPANALRNVRHQRQQRLLATRSLRDHLISLAGIVHGPVLNQAGEEIGTLADVVARWDGQESYPPVTGVVVHVGRREALPSRPRQTRASTPAASVASDHQPAPRAG